MSNLPPDTQAFRSWLKIVGDFDAAALATGIGVRKLQRFHSGKERAHPRLLRELAAGADEAGQADLGRRLRDAADLREGERGQVHHA